MSSSRLVSGRDDMGANFPTYTAEHMAIVAYPTRTTDTRSDELHSADCRLSTSSGDDNHPSGFIETVPFDNREWKPDATGRTKADAAVYEN